MFNAEGLVPIKSHLWKRALLSIGPYIMSAGRNRSFLTNPAANGNSWKRFLRNQTEKRQYLKTLFDRLDAFSAIEPQLNQIIGGATNLEPWQTQLVKHPKLISYCGEQEMRWEDGSDQIYLLKKRQMNGAHAELFSYALYQELDSDAARKDLEPLKLDSYQFVTMTELEPALCLSFICGKGCVSFVLFSFHKEFRYRVNKTQLANLPHVEAALKNGCGFSENAEELTRSSSREEVHGVLRQIASSLARLPVPTS